MARTTGWVLVAALGVAGRASGAEPPPLDAQVTASDGAPVRLSAQWGRPVVLFYEDRHSVAQNQATKDALFAAGRQRGLLQRVGVVAVANLQELNWQPALFFALEAVKGEEKKAGVPIFLDLDGTLSRPPWRLPARTSTVLVIDPRGREVFRASGALTAAQQQALFAAVERWL